MSDKKEQEDEDGKPSPSPPTSSASSRKSSDDAGKSRGSEKPSSSSGSASAGTNFISDILSKLKFRRRSSASASPEKILEEASLEGLKAYIESGKCHNIVVMAGAGISTSAGIPDFRSPDTGLYASIQKKYRLPHPQAMFEIGYFKSNPGPFYELAKEILPESYNPTTSHYFVKLLQDKGLLLRHYTQNVDGLERKAGIQDDKIVEAHGSFYKSHCLGCNKEYSFEWMKEKIRNSVSPQCTACKKLIKPDIIFFGESLPPRFFHCAQTDFKKVDLLIIMGTSLAVQPFASLIDKAPPTCPRLLINREKVGINDESSFLAQLRKRFVSQEDFDITGEAFGALLGREGFNFEDPRNRDLALVGDCDGSVVKLASSFGWGEDLQKLIDNKVVVDVDSTG